MKDFIFFLIISFFLTSCGGNSTENVEPQQVNCEVGSVPFLLESRFDIPPNTPHTKEITKTVKISYNYLDWLHSSGFTQDSIESIALDTLSINSEDEERDNSDCGYNSKEEWVCKDKKIALPAIYNIKFFLNGIKIFEKFPQKGITEIEFKSIPPSNDFKNLIQSQSLISFDIIYVLSVSPNRNHSISLKAGFCAKIKK